MRKLLLVAALFVTHAHAAFENCLEIFPSKTIPVVSQSNSYPLCFSEFAVLYSAKTKTPIYTVEKLNRAKLANAKSQQRTNKFYEEARLPRAARATLEDYRGCGFNRGHMAPAADMASPEAMAQSFSLANMVPQAPENNQGVWAHRVEAATRRYVERAGGDVYVFTGPVYAGEVQSIGPNQVWVPTYLYKLVYDPNAHKAWAFWVKNTNKATVSRPISYPELVRRTGIEFLPHVTLKE